MSATLAGIASPAKTGRPSLYTGTLGQNAKAQGASILGELESSRPRRKRWGAVLAALLALALAAAGWQALHGRLGEKQLIERRQSAVPVAAVAPVAAVVAATTTPPTASPDGAGTASPATAPAAIPGEAAVPAVAQLETAPFVLGPVSVPLEQSLAPEEELLPEKAQAVPAPLPTQAPAVAPVIAAVPPVPEKRAVPAVAAVSAIDKVPPRQASQLATRPAVPGNAPGVHAQSPTPARDAAAVGKADRKDGDVELIAALLNRVSAKLEPSAGESVRKPGPGEVQKRPMAGPQKKNKKSGNIRETIALPSVDSAELQLKRCGSLGFFEAEMCRLRICAGRWGSAPGCPEHAQASAYAP